VDYGYDQGANGIGRLGALVETDPAGAIRRRIDYAYDIQGRIIAETRMISGIAHVTRYGYDAAGRLIQTTYPGGRTVDYALDALGRIAGVSTTREGATQVLASNVQYRPFGGLAGFAFGNGQPYTRTFDADGRVTGHTLGAQSLELTRDGASRITSIADPANPLLTKSYGYDALDRLTGYTATSTSQAFAYDPVGNRLAKTTGGALETYAYPPTSNRLASITSDTGALKSFQHDANGSITSDGANQLAYDARGRLVSAATAIGPVAYQVNALGQRAVKQSPEGVTLFHYDREGRLIAESDVAGTPQKEYLWLGDTPLAVVAYAAGTGGCGARPALDTGASFVPFSGVERLEVRGGNAGPAWEWGLGPDTTQEGGMVKASLDWVSGKLYGFTLTYGASGVGTLEVRDGALPVFTRSWEDPGRPLRTGNALRFAVNLNPSVTAGNALTVTLTRLEGEALSETLQLEGNGQEQALARSWRGTALQDGFTVQGTIGMSFPGTRPPTGSRMDFSVTAGNVACEGGAAPPAATLYYVHADHLDTPRAIADEQNRIVWRWDNTDPFGANAPDEDPDGDGQRFVFNLRFPGQYFDRETWLHYNLARDYSPEIGRYIQSDPIGLRGGPNTFSYADQNPVLRTDPSGLAVWLCIRAVENIRVGNHSYFWDDKSNRCCGRTPGKDPLRDCKEAGPNKDFCVLISSSDEDTDRLFKCCGRRAKEGPYIPRYNDCQDTTNDCIREMQMAPPANIDRWRPCQSCWRQGPNY
jgi:RHS repeat-associated protein